MKSIHFALAGSLFCHVLLWSPVRPSPAAQPPDEAAPPAASGTPSADAAGADATDAAPAGAPERTNRLVGETSPYLQMHAHNPVDWFPWGDEALAKARRENKPIFLSIGYSSCHWCHVMERESFLDEEIAAHLNEHFVCIKVDREERPDIDSIYMTSLQVYNRLSGSRRGGGWPLSMFLLPDGRPFFGGTYFPARDGDRGVPTGFLTLIRKIQEIWATSPEKIEADAQVVVRATKTELESRGPVATRPIDAGIVDATLTALREQFDPEYGGFGYSLTNPLQPKFPEPSNLQFLLATKGAEQRQKAQEMLVVTLDRMARGGIRDHVGGGFHRYSVDRFWSIPHFEKMLYDNGQLASVYAAAYEATGNEEFRRVVEQLLAFVAREMTDEGGAFYAALDAETEGEEGKFYRWTKGEFDQLLDDNELSLLNEVYDLAGEPNFEGEYYVLELARPLAMTAEGLKTTADALDARLQPVRAKLLASRNQRPRPLTDTKILTAWNGLMIRGFADAGRILERPSHVDSAVRAADFILEKLRTDDGRLLRTYTDGDARLNAYLDDYAFLVDGLLALHRATGQTKWLAVADELTATQIEFFWDEQHGGFFFTADDHESLLARSRNLVDGARPSGNSVSVSNLVYLARELDRPDYLDKAGRTIESIAGLLQVAPAAAPRMVVGVGEWLDAKP